MLLVRTLLVVSEGTQTDIKKKQKTKKKWGLITDSQKQTLAKTRRELALGSWDQRLEF